MLENVSFESSQSLCTRFKICNQTIQKLKAFKCVNCIFATNSYIKFLLHLNPKMNSSNDKLKQKKNCKPFKCQNCMFITKSVSKFTFHSVNIPENSISVNDKSSCRICNKSFISKNALTEHMLCHTFKGDVVSKKKRQGIKKIELCNQMDETKIFYDIENNSTKIFNDMENNSLMTNKNNTSTTNQNNVSRLNKICNICNVVFVSSKTFNAHLLLHQPPKYICSVCNKTFILQTVYEKHLLCHKNEPTIKIKPNNCSTSIYKSHSLSNHKSFDEVTRTHAKDKTTTIGTQNNCSVSTNEINVSNNQNALADVENYKKVPKTKKTKVKEQKNLVKKKLFPCPFCNDQYETKNSLRYHTKQKHPNKKVSTKNNSKKCEFCPSLITKKNMLRHIRLVHSNVKLSKCNHCSMTFKDLILKKLHSDRCHKN